MTPQQETLYDAVAKLIKAKGRFHTEQNYAALVTAFDADTAARRAPAPTEPAVDRDAVIAEVRAEVSEMRNHLEAFGEYSQETARCIIDGVVDTIDDMLATPAVPDAQRRAIMESHRNAAADSYFGARSPLLDTVVNQNLFEAGFQRGYEAAAPQVAQASQPTSAEGKDSERLNWQPITAPGQVKVGDKLRFTIGDTHYDEIVKVVLHPGTEREEMIYNKRKNYYVITKNILTGFGNVKDLTFLRVCTGKDTDKEAK